VISTGIFFLGGRILLNPGESGPILLFLLGSKRPATEQSAGFVHCPDVSPFSEIENYCDGNPASLIDAPGRLPVAGGVESEGGQRLLAAPSE
jgi:hypothetical protein